MRTICCYGGAFDPVHYGHLYFAKAIINRLHPDKLILIPANVSPFKNEGGHAAAQHRLQMLMLACSGIPNCLISDLEIQRNGNSYTIDTLKTLHDTYDDSRLFWVIGDDHLDSLEQWKDYPDHFHYADFLVLPRQYTLPEINKRLLKNPHASHFHLLDTAPYPMSSTAIRKKIRRGDPVDRDLPAAVSQYIRDHHLYKDES
jgi:nicotinate-nucleotide adenylyltransferase